jgi:glycosyltransferase involved in cell wall biosynthesis
MTTLSHDPSRPIKLLMLSHYFDSHRGGIEFVARELFRRLGRPQCEITWAAASASAPPQCGRWTSALPLASWNGLENTIGVPFPVPTLSAVKQLWFAVRSSDVLLLHDCLYLSNIAAFLFARLLRIPVAIVQHTGKLSCNNFALSALMAAATAIVTRSMLRSASQVVFISQTTQGYFDGLRWKHVPALVFNGVQTETFHPPADKASKSELRKHLGLPTDASVALFVGRFVQSKGVHILEQMARSAPQITWAFAGSGPVNPSAWRLSNVSVYSDLDHGSVADLYRASDVFVLPSLREGFPLVIQEALACGLPVVCTADITTADNALAAFVRGVPIAPGDDQRSAEDFLTAVHQILREAAVNDRAAQRFEFVQHRYSWAGVIEKYFQIVRRITAPTRAADARDFEQDAFAPPNTDEGRVVR